MTKTQLPLIIKINPEPMEFNPTNSHHNRLNTILHNRWSNNPISPLVRLRNKIPFNSPIRHKTRRLKIKWKIYLNYNQT